jgi:putative transposase
MSGNELAIERMCELAGVSRRSLYRFDPEAKPADRDLGLRDTIQRIALEMPSYGGHGSLPDYDAVAGW